MLSTDITNVSTSAFSLREAVGRLCKRSGRKEQTVCDKFTFFLDHSLVDLYKQTQPLFSRLSLLTGVRYMLVGRFKNSRGQYLHDYLYDFRFDQEPQHYTAHSLRAVYWIVDVRTGALVLETTSRAKIPRFNYWSRQRHRIKARLCEILPLEQNHNDVADDNENDIADDDQHHKKREAENLQEPQTPQELLAFLKQHDLAESANFYVSYCVNFRQKGMHTFLDVYNNQPNQEELHTFRFWAYPLSATKIAYAYFQPEKKRRSDDLMFYVTPDKDIPVPKPDTINRKLAVHIELTGLTLAHKLGCCSRSELVEMATAFSMWVGGLWITYDDKKHARHVAFATQQQQYISVPLGKCEGDSSTQWIRFLKQVEASASDARKHKEAILRPVLDRLEPYHRLNKRDAWCKCYNSLVSAVHKYKVFVYGSDDISLHVLKGPVAGVFKRKWSKGVTMHMLVNNNIAALSTRDIDFLNLNEYINYEGTAFDPWRDDGDLWKVVGDWTSLVKQEDGQIMPDDEPWESPKLRHSNQNLRSYPRLLPNTTMIKYLANRGQRNAEAIRQLWLRLVTFLASGYGYDLATRGHTSLSKLSFDIVWLRYAETAGPLAHAFEILHPYTEHVVRPWCRGGFSYSANTYLAEGQPLFSDDDNSENAASIRELDLTSAYGCSGASMATPTGFGITFGHGTRTQRRYNLYEYRAVYYTLFKWTRIEGRNIVSVFSNFSPLGIIFVGKYPLDLVAVFDDGSATLVQFDGHYCHGDYRNNEADENARFRPCHSLPRYAEGRSRHDCEAKTMDRDQFILNWMMQVTSHKMSYEVYTDCCHPEYHPLNLKRAFDVCRELAELVRGLDDVNGSLEYFLKNDNKDVTFFALVEGYARKNDGGGNDDDDNNDRWNQTTFGPVFQFENDGPPTFSSGKMLLTSDYYRYLVEQVDFLVTSLHWIVYYKRCRHLPAVFEQLVSARQSLPKGSSVAGLLKSIVNYSCGYFGLHKSKQPRTNTRIVYRLPSNFNYSIHEVSPLPYFAGVDLYILRTLSPTSHFKYQTTMPLLHFFGIIEYGKMQINRALRVLWQHLRPTAIRHLYSNVDNIILACSADRFQDALVDTSPAGTSAFLRDWMPLLGTEPGKLKEEWIVPSGHRWKFVTPYCMFYVLTTDDDRSEDRHKTNCFKGLVTREIFDIALQIWNNKDVVVVDIEKRKNKLVDFETHRVTHRLFPKLLTTPAGATQEQQHNNDDDVKEEINSEIYFYKDGIIYF